jgi:hypothetical protein
MNQVAQPVSTAQWIGRVIVAVLVGQGLWGLISALTTGVILPVLSRQMGGASQSPQPLNVQAIFGAVISLCIAGVVAVILNAWASRPVSGQRVMAAAPAARTVARPAPATLSINPSAAPAAVVLKPTAPPPAPTAPATFAAPPAPPTPPPAPAKAAEPAVAATPRPNAPVAPPAAPKPVAPAAPVPAAVKPTAPAPPPKPSKPKPPREIQYNIVGEPISPMDEDD